MHTLVVPESNTENTVLFVRVAGTNINFTDDAQFHSLLDASSLRFLTDTLAEQQGLGPAPCIGGGAADVTGTRGLNPRAVSGRRSRPKPTGRSP